MELQRITGINAGTEFANFQVKGIGMANTYMANAKISLYEIEKLMNLTFLSTKKGIRTVFTFK